MRTLIRSLYTQGQYNGKIREYFYYVSHHGFLFLDDSRMKNFTAAYKDVQFLNFFFAKIKENRTGRYQDTFPWVSLCGIERNFLRCDDTPLVYTELDGNSDRLRVGQSLVYHPFQPESLEMTSSGRVYHQCPIGGRALVADRLTDKLYHQFEFDSDGNPHKMSAPPAPKKARSRERMHDESVVCEEDEMDSPFTLFFLRLPEANEQENKEFEGLFKVAHDSLLLPEWTDVDTVERIHSSDDFFIVPCFRGKFFRKLQERKLRLYGTPIVFECLEEEKQLPLWNHPVFSSVFEGAKVTFSCMEQEKRRELREKVAWMGGVVSEGLFHETTHLVCGRAEQSEKYKAAVSNSIRVMRTDWIDEMWEQSQTAMGKFSAITRDAVDAYKLRVFEGLTMAITSIDGFDRTNLIQLIQEHGGQVPGTMSRTKSSHLVTDCTNSQKYKKAMEWKTIKVVQTRWVRKCIDLGHLIDEAKYHPKYLASEHIRSSTPKRDANMTETGPDVSSISGRGGRLSISTFNASCSVLTPITASTISATTSVRRSLDTSIVASSTIQQTFTASARKNDNFVPPAVPLVRHQSVTATSIHDPIDELRERIGGMNDLFENCMFFVCGVEENRMEKWRRFLDATGATRVPKIETATNVVVVAPTVQEKAIIRKFLARDDIAIVNVHWVEECVKQRQVVSPEGYEWSDQEGDSQSQRAAPSSETPVPVPSTASTRSRKTALTSYSEPPPTQAKGIFATRSYAVHSSLGKAVAEQLKQKIVESGGVIEEVTEKAEIVVFGATAPVNELLTFDVVVTDLYICTCIANEMRLKVCDHALFVPLPRSPIPPLNQIRFFLVSEHPSARTSVKAIIESNGGVVVDSPDHPKTFIVMMDPGKVSAAARSRTVDLSWIVSSVSRCRLQPIGQHLYKDDTKPLGRFERDDDVWMKCLREKDVTQEMEEEQDERDRVDEAPMEYENRKPLSPMVNPYFPDLRKPYKMNLHLDGVSEIINNMESPPPESQESMTTSRVGSILRKAVVNTGRMPDEPIFRPPSVVVAENRRTVSSTPVLQRSVDRFPPMSDTFVNQNQEHQEELNRRYAMHPHFLLSISDLSKQESAELQEGILQLGGIIDRNFNSDVSILVAAKLGRVPKTLSAIAAGRWCLTPDYVTRSVAAGHWLEEEPFEWRTGKLANGANKIERELARVCSMWRDHVAQMPITHSVSMESRQNGAFSEWRVVIHADDRSTQSITSILEAGGAAVFSISEYIELPIHRPTMVFAAKNFEWNLQSAAMLKRDGIPLYLFDLIYAFLVENGKADRSKYFHPSYEKV
ncbi:unnamed protein product [Caenorhabditis sp. 36 PRJEB53466]|nr:unnamed protein product [Caenorhabditis sp. 36 PRJEB53466]